MGCCGSKEDDSRFEDQAALLPKNGFGRNQGDVVKAKQQALGNGHYTKPVTTASELAPPPSVAKPKDACCGGCNGSQKIADEKPLDEVHPTIETVDLLGLDQPPSPPNSPAVPTVLETTTKPTPPPPEPLVVTPAPAPAPAPALVVAEPALEESEGLEASVDNTEDADGDGEEETSGVTEEKPEEKTPATTSSNSSSKKKKKKKKGKK